MIDALQLIYQVDSGTLGSAGHVGDRSSHGRLKLAASRVQNLITASVIQVASGLQQIFSIRPVPQTADQLSRARGLRASA